MAQGWSFRCVSVGKGECWPVSSSKSCHVYAVPRCIGHGNALLLGILLSGMGPLPQTLLAGHGVCTAAASRGNAAAPAVLRCLGFAAGAAAVCRRPVGVALRRCGCAVGSVLGSSTLPGAAVSLAAHSGRAAGAARPVPSPPVHLLVPLHQQVSLPSLCEVAHAAMGTSICPADTS